MDPFFHRGFKPAIEADKTVECIRIDYVQHNNRICDEIVARFVGAGISSPTSRVSTSKTGRHQVLPIATPLRSYLAELPASDKPTAPLFPYAYEAVTTNIHAGILSRQFGELLASAGLAKVTESHLSTGKGRTAPRERNPLSFHSLRHTATSMLKAAGVSQAVARDIIGHDSAEISRHYTHVDESSKRKAIARLPDITALAKPSTAH